MKVVPEQTQKKNKLKNEGGKPDVSFDVIIGDEHDQELEYILLNKRQHYIEVVNSLDSCLKEALKKPETKKTLPDLTKVRPNDQ